MAVTAEEIEVILAARDKMSGVVDKVNKKVGGLGSVVRKLASPLKAATGALGNMAQVAGGVLAARAIPAAVNGVRDLVSEAAQVERVSNTFDKLTQSIGGVADSAMDKLRAATSGMLSDADLMSAANKFMSMGLASTEDEMAHLAHIASQLGSAMGEDVTGSMENLALMLANQSIMRLDSFGVSGAKVRERMEELQASVEGMTRETAFMTAFQEQAAVTLERVGDQSQGSAAAMARLAATFDNVKVVAGKSLLPVVQALLQPLGDLALKIGPAAEEWGQRFAETMTNRIVPGISAFLGHIARVPGFLADIVNNFRGGEVFDVLQEGLQEFGVDKELATKIAHIGDWLQYDLPEAIEKAKAPVEAALGKVREAIDTGLGALRFGVEVAGRGGAGRGAASFLRRMGLPLADANEIGGIFGRIAGVVERGVEQVQSGFGKIAGGIRGGDMGQALGGVLDIATLVGSMKTQLLEQLFDVGDSLLNVLVENVPSLEPFVEAVLRPLFGLGDRIVEAFVGMRDAVFSQLLEMFAGLAPVIQEALPDVGSLLTETLGGAVELLSTVFEDVSAFVAPLVGEMAAFITTEFSGVVAWFMENLPLLQGVITTALTAIQAIWTAVWPYLQQTLVTVWEVIQGVVSTALDTIMGLISTVLLAIHGDWAGAWEMLKTTAVNLWNGLMSTVQGLLDNLLQLFDGQAGMRGLLVIVETIWNTAKQIVETQINNLVSLVNGIILAFQGDWQGAWDEVKAIVERTLGLFSGIATTLLDGFLKIFRTDLETVAGIVEEKLTDAKEKISETVGKWKQAGKDLIQGLIDGVKEKANDLVGAAKGVVDDAVQAARNLLGIHSPSTVFIEFGRMMMEGLTVGIDYGKAKTFGKISEAIEELVAAFRSFSEFQMQLPSVELAQEWATRFQALSHVLVEAVNTVGYTTSTIRKAKSNAVRLGKILTSMAVDLSHIKVYDLPDLNVWGQQVYGLVRTLIVLVGRIKDAAGTSKNLEVVAGLAEHIRKIVDLVNLSFENMKVATSLPNGSVWSEQVQSLTVLIVKTVNQVIDSVGEGTLKQVANVVDVMTRLFGMLGPDLANAVQTAEVADFEGAATQRLEQLKFVAGRIYAWLKDVSDELRESIARAGEAAGAVQSLFVMLGPDLSKAVAVSEAADFEALAQRRVDQLSYVAGRIYAWLKGVSVQLAASISHAGDVAGFVNKLFVMLGPDLSKATAVNEAGDFEALAQRRVLQLSYVAGRIYDWLRDVSDELAKSIERAGGVAESVSKLMSLLTIDLSLGTGAEDLADFRTQFEAFEANLQYAALEMATLLDKLATHWGSDMLERVHAAAEKIRPVLEMLNLGKLIEELQIKKRLQAGERKTAFTNVIKKLVDDIRFAAQMLKDNLPGIEAIFGDSLEDMTSISEKAAVLFEHIASLVKSTNEIANGETIDVARVAYQLKSLGEVASVAQGTLGGMQVPTLGGGLGAVGAQEQRSLFPAPVLASEMLDGLKRSIVDAIREGIEKGTLRIHVSVVSSTGYAGDVVSEYRLAQEQAVALSATV